MSFKITLELPDRASRSNLWLMDEGEPFAYLPKDGSNWFVKTSSCSRCGKCCTGNEGNSHFALKEDGTCEHLIQEGGATSCGLGLFRPFQCCIATRSSIPDCTVRYEEVK